MTNSTSVWLAMPACNPDKCAVNLPKWKAQGYRVALLQDRVHFESPHADIIVRPWPEYRGYYKSANYLIRNAVPTDCPLVVCAGDDMEPDPKVKASEILKQFYQQFPDGFGVMQPVGDPWMVDQSGRSAAERICGSPFFGRDYIRRANGGKGPWPEHYHHFYGDEEVHDTAILLGVLWQRKDLTHLHHHWARTPNAQRPASYNHIQEHWDSDRATFMARQRDGFPGHEPTPQTTMAHTPGT